MENLAVIDLGSNSARMTITEIHDDGSYQVVQRMKRMVRLSENMGEEKTLKSSAMDRTIQALKDFQEVYEQLPQVTLRAVATAAVRMAKNQKEFLKRVSDEVDGLALEVITGAMEAHYDYLGVVNTLPITNCVIMDTGGASCELILVQNGKAQNLVSIPVGAVNLSEKFFKNRTDVLRAQDLFWEQTFVNRLFNGIWWLHRGQNLPIVALGGSNRTLAKIYRKKVKELNFEDIHGYRMSVDQIDTVYADIIGKNLEQRRDIPGLARDRADIIAGGITPIVTILRYLDSDRITFSQNGVREGILFEHITKRQDEGKL